VEIDLTSQATLIATADRLLSAEELRSLSGRVDVLEMRADRVGECDVDSLRAHFSARTLFTLRSREEGGGFGGSLEERHRVIEEASSKYDFVDLELRRDLTADVLACVPPEKRIISWHGGPTDLGALQGILEDMTEIPAAYYKLVSDARKSGEELAPLALLLSCRRTDVVAFASGTLGCWTRLIAPRLGAPVIYVAAGARPAAPGQIPLSILERDYGGARLREIECLRGVVGQRAERSLSPRLHNTLYRHLNIPALYVPFSVDSFGDFWLEIVEGGSLEVLGFPLVGLSVTAPYKEIAMAVAGATSPFAEAVASANTLVLRGRVWEADSTDAGGVIEPLRQRGIGLDGKNVAVLGAGGAGRAVAAQLHRAGARVALVNRSSRRGQESAKTVGLPYIRLRDFQPGEYNLIVNATSLGSDSTDNLPFEAKILAADAAVVDLVYLADGPTPLVEQVEASGRIAVDGREVLLQQAVAQFRLMTGQDLPVDLGRETLGLGSGG